MSEEMKTIAVIDHQIDICGRSPLVDFLRDKCCYRLFYGRNNKEAEIIITSEEIFDLLVVKEDIKAGINAIEIIQKMLALRVRKNTPILVLRRRPKRTADLLQPPLPDQAHLLFYPLKSEVLKKNLVSLLKKPV